MSFVDYSETLSITPSIFSLSSIISPTTRPKTTYVSSTLANLSFTPLTVCWTESMFSCSWSRIFSRSYSTLDLKVFIFCSFSLSCCWRSRVTLFFNPYNSASLPLIKPIVFFTKRSSKSFIDYIFLQELVDCYFRMTIAWATVGPTFFHSSGLMASRTS
jgi:hypothetical protein